MPKCCSFRIKLAVIDGSELSWANIGKSAWRRQIQFIQVLYTTQPLPFGYILGPLMDIFWVNEKNWQSTLPKMFIVTQRMYYLFLFPSLRKWFYVYKDKTSTYKMWCCRNKNHCLLLKLCKVLKRHIHIHIFSFVFLFSDLLCVTWPWLRWVFKLSILRFLDCSVFDHYLWFTYLLLYCKTCRTI